MKAESNIRPSDFEIENVSKERCDVVLNTNIEEIEQEENTKYIFDTYRLNICYNENIEEEIRNNYDRYLNNAKNNEANELATEIRKKRDALLNETDWTQMTDSALDELQKEKYRIYRQALRDIPEQPGFPYDVEFPVLEKVGGV